MQLRQERGVGVALFAADLGDESAQRRHIVGGEKLGLAHVAALFDRQQQILALDLLQQRDDVVGFRIGACCGRLHLIHEPA